MPITDWQDIPRVFAGNIVLEEVSGQGQLSVRDAINADLSVIPPAAYVQPFGAAVWSTSVRIREYETSAVKFLSGFPTRAQFGSLTYYSVASFIETQWIQHEVQTFKPQRCVVLPITYLDVPFSTADIQPLTQTTHFSTATGYGVSLGLSVGYDTLAGATGFYYDFPATITADISVFYYGRVNEEYTNSGTNRHTMLNY